MMEKQAPQGNMKELLHKYRLDHPVAPDSQKRMMAHMGPMYRRILKRTGRHSLITGIVLWIYFLLRRYGIVITTGKAIIVTIVLLVFSLGGILAFFMLQHRPDSAVNRKGGVVDIRVDRDSAPVQPPRPVYALAIEPFTGEGVDRGVRTAAMKAIAGQLGALRGGSFSTIVWNRNTEGMKYRMTGSVEKSGDEMFLFVKVVDLRTSSIVYVAKEKADSLDGIPDACRRVSQGVAERVR